MQHTSPLHMHTTCAIVPVFSPVVWTLSLALGEEMLFEYTYDVLVHH